MRHAEQRITNEVVESHGLNNEEYRQILKILGRDPNLVELGIFSVMWSEHCSYKSTRKWLKRLPTKAPWVICGPGENAGVIDIGNGLAAIFKMESHNHPSYIEPYQGAATGVGGILRDVFTMGARPVANLNSLRFGDINHPKTRHLLEGVVSGIGGYGNCVGVPTVGGECTFHPSYNGNILVNAMTVGIAKANKIFYSKASGIGNSVVYVGSKTGRDGIHGATMASAEFDEKSEEKRPTVQVGDPFTEKLLIEACLELMETDSIIAIQDMGAAGLTSSSVEMAGKGGCGIVLNLEKVPTREEGMTPYEIMLSESQERMLMIIKPEKEELVKNIFKKWELEFAVIGKITNTGDLEIKMNGKNAATIPVMPLSQQAPIYDRPWKITPKRDSIDLESIKTKVSPLTALKKLLSTPDLSNKRWIWEQYDHMVMNDTVERPGGDAAVVRIHGSNRALAVTSDCTPRYCYADPVEGGKQAVVETWRNITSVGGKPLAITNCLNFGNPQKPEIMGQIIGCLQGMSEACEVLNYPIVSGNVSLYNETNGTAIFPTPSIGGVGIIEDLEKRTNSRFDKIGEEIIIIGKTAGHIGSSLFLREVIGREDGNPPPVNLENEINNGNFIREIIENKMVSSCHDVADGGLAVAITEMALSSVNNVGAEIKPTKKINQLAWLFGEDQGRYIISASTANANKIMQKAKKQGVHAEKIGKTIKGFIKIGTEKLELQKLRKINEDFFKNYTR